MRDVFAEISVFLSQAQSLWLLLIRFVLAYGFLNPIMMKMKDISKTGLWFESLDIPIPHFFAYVVTGAEAIGFALLILGLATRYISSILAIVMIVAIMTVHLPNGFHATAMGFEVPLYYLLFFLILITKGAGRFSLDQLFFSTKSHI